MAQQGGILFRTTAEGEWLSLEPVWAMSREVWGVENKAGQLAGQWFEVAPTARESMQGEAVSGFSFQIGHC